MQEARTINYECPYCHKTFEVQLYDVVNAEDVDLKERCMSGDIFRVSCPHCKKDYLIQYPLVYIDQANRFILWLSQNEMGEALRAYTKNMKGYKFRRCESIAQFVEKIQIFEDGIDDVMVELAKYDCFIEFVDNKKGKPEDITSIEYQKADNGVIKINVRTDDQGMSFLIPVSMLEEEMAEHPDYYEVKNEEFPLINGEWIRSLFQESAGEA